MMRVGLILGGILCFAGSAVFAQPPKDLPAEPVVTYPLVPGFERFYHQVPGDNLGGDLAMGGRLLLGELNCVACHPAAEGLAKHLNVKQAPILDTVGARVRPTYLRSFLADPKKSKP